MAVELSLPIKDYEWTRPLVEAGIMELNENPDLLRGGPNNLPYSLAHIVPDVAHSPDKILQDRIPFYNDTHRYTALGLTTKTSRSTGRLTTRITSIARTAIREPT